MVNLIPKQGVAMEIFDALLMMVWSLRGQIEMLMMLGQLEI